MSNKQVNASKALSTVFRIYYILKTRNFQLSLSVVSDSANPWTAALQASLSITNAQSLLKLMSVESLMPSNHQWYIYTMEYYLTLQRMKIPFVATWIQLEIIILNEVSQKESQMPYDITFM